MASKLVGDTVRMCRETKAFMTQTALAERAGLTVSALSDIETGKSLPRLSTLNRLCNAMQLGPADRQLVLEARAKCRLLPEVGASTEFPRPASVGRGVCPGPGAVGAAWWSDSRVRGVWFNLEPAFIPDPEWCRAVAGALNRMVELVVFVVEPDVATNLRERLVSAGWDASRPDTFMAVRIPLIYQPMLVMMRLEVRWVACGGEEASHEVRVLPPVDAGDSAAGFTVRQYSARSLVNMLEPIVKACRHGDRMLATSNWVDQGDIVRLKRRPHAETTRELMRPLIFTPIEFGDNARQGPAVEAARTQPADEAAPPGPQRKKRKRRPAAQLLG